MEVKIGPYPTGDGNRQIEIHIDNYDIWNMDHTLALIIHPMLVRMRNAKPGSPLVANEDVPKELHRKAAISDGTDEHWHARWEYVLDEMIYTFSCISNDWDWHTNPRVTNGLTLFGKYYASLWT